MSSSSASQDKDKVKEKLNAKITKLEKKLQSQYKHAAKQGKEELTT